MIIRKINFEAAIPSCPFPFSLDNCIFFDIETTGFSRKFADIYLIGMAKKISETTFELTQFFSDDGDEPALLTAFFNALPQDCQLIHYNGNSFDLPFLEAKSAFYETGFNFQTFTGIDFYKKISSFKHVLSLPNLKQKTVEPLFGFAREDKCEGGELISVYQTYLKKKDSSLAELLFLHNRDDLQGLVSLLHIYELSAFFSGDFQFVRYEQGQMEYYLHFQTNLTFSYPLSWHKDNVYFHLENHSFTMRIPVFEGELKFFYPDYKNYYYLPKEDMAIHKSLAFYVEKEFRQKAKASNCYQRKSGQFLPAIHPEGAAFKSCFDAKESFVLPDFLDESEKVCHYTLAFLQDSLS